ncbi:MAG: hypothetical protein IGS39_18760 [Calothrix sp. C42_A2020_038]|nr:hypothetical protein [Calothrix sp. C42_A2020_038]
MVRLLEKKKAKTSVLTIFALTTFGLHLLALFVLVLQGFSIHRMNLQKPPNFVQLVDGKTVDIGSQEIQSNLEPQPETIRQFVNKTMTLMFNWSGKLPPQSIDEATQPQRDNGISVPTRKGSQKLSTTSWVAGFGLSEDFRKGFLVKIAEMTPPEVFSNSSQAITSQLAVKRIYPPKKIAPGKWQVGMVADLIQKRQSTNQSIITPFNKDLLVRSVDSFAFPQVSMKTDLQKAIYSVRTDKLEIYEIRNLCLVDEYSSLTPDKSCGNLKNDQTFIK